MLYAACDMATQRIFKTIVKVAPQQCTVAENIVGLTRGPWALLIS